MAHEYAELADLKSNLNVEEADLSRDVMLQAALTAASRGIDTSTGRRFWLDDVPVARVFRTRGRVAFTEDGGERLLVDDIGADPVLVESGSVSSWADVPDYEPGPDNALLRGRPITSLAVPGRWAVGDRVRVVARWGWPAVPDEIRQATLIQAARLYRRKDSPEGVAGSAEWGVMRLSRRDPDVWALIEHFILPGFG
ncbi:MULTISPECIES: phage gp6-like head-tail connector protein [Streptomyces]|uniref:phage gp6-like head-tail connector protein n=1 Tax=Streptomyces TaxID=1883 RepID=UPI0036992C31